MTPQNHGRQPLRIQISNVGLACYAMTIGLVALLSDSKFAADGSLIARFLEWIPMFRRIVELSDFPGKTFNATIVGIYAVPVLALSAFLRINYAVWETFDSKQRYALVGSSVALPALVTAALSVSVVRNNGYSLLGSYMRCITESVQCMAIAWPISMVVVLYFYLLPFATASILTCNLISKRSLKND